MFSIYTVFPRGFCAWVFRAVHMLDEIVKLYGAPVYVNHEIIHNKFIISYFEKKWVIFGQEIESIPENSLIVVSAHGVGPSFFTRLQERKLRYVDATCPLVEKVHKEAANFVKNGYKIVYIWQKNHQEAMGVKDFSPENITVISSKEEADSTLITLTGEKLALLTQTTLSVDDTQELIEYVKSLFPLIELPRAGDICYATTNRQNAVKKLAEKVDTIFIVGSKNSSNSNKLKYLAEKLWKKAFLIDTYTDIDASSLSWVSSVGVSSWASWPEELVQWVVQYLTTRWWTFVEEIRVVEEKITFPYSLEIKN